MITERITWSDIVLLPERVESLLRDAELFRGWLDDWAPSAVVGYARSDASCPLARFLSELLGSEVEVRGQRAYTKDSGHLLLPRWARYFVALIDVTASQMPSPVTAAEARRLLGDALDWERMVLSEREG